MAELFDPRSADDIGVASCATCRGGQMQFSESPCGPGCCSVRCPWCGGDTFVLGTPRGGVTTLSGQPLGEVTDAHREYSRDAWLHRYRVPQVLEPPVFLDLEEVPSPLRGPTFGALLGCPGVRDPDFPCIDFAPGRPLGRCEGDGHYLCRDCKELRLCGECARRTLDCTCEEGPT